MSIGAIPSSGGVEAAIRRASNATGVDADFLVRTARRESAMNPSAKARTSSAAGLFQLSEQTWLGTVKAHGAKHGYGQYADLIYRGGDGRWRVEGSARNVVLDLRFDPQAAANRSIFYRDGRPATVAEVHANLQRSAGDGAPAAAAGSGQTVPDLSERDQMLAARLDRLKQDQSLLALLLGQDGDGKNGGFGGAFGPDAEARI